MDRPTVVLPPDTLGEYDFNPQYLARMRTMLTLSGARLTIVQRKILSIQQRYVDLSQERFGVRNDQSRIQ